MQRGAVARARPAFVAPRSSLRSFQRDLAPLNLDTLEFFIQKGRIDASKPITMKELYDANVCGKFADGVKLLARVRVHPSRPSRPKRPKRLAPFLIRAFSSPFVPR